MVRGLCAIVRRTWGAVQRRGLRGVEVLSAVARLLLLLIMLLLLLLIVSVVLVVSVLLLVIAMLSILLLMLLTVGIASGIYVVRVRNVSLSGAVGILLAIPLLP